MSHFFIPIKKAELDWQGTLPLSTQFDDIYHSAEGGVQQSLHVFVAGNNLIKRWQSLADQELKRFTIAETGFGMGLNFLVSWHLWEEHAPVEGRLHFISCEKHPLSHADLTKSLAFWPELEEKAQQLIAAYPVLTPGYHHLSFCDGRVTLTLMLGDALACYEQLLVCAEPLLESQLRTTWVDAWYLDGFTPAKNKSMWSDDLIYVIAMLSKKETTLASYTVASSVKTCLKQYGFRVEKKKGFGSKRHMLCAQFTELSVSNNHKYHTPWHVSKSIQNTNKSAVIVGAGLAGCFTANSLAKRGWKVTIIDELDGVAGGGSGNQQAVLFPNLSAYNAPLTQFMLASFLYAVSTYQSILKHHQLGELNGALLLASSEKERLAQERLCEWLTYYPELGVLVDVQRATELAGLSVSHSGLFLPLSGWINSPALCHYLIQREEIELITKHSVNELIFDKRWMVNELETDVLILANGHKITSFHQTDYLPLQPIRGQMTSILATESSAHLKIPLCAEGHVLPAVNGMHSLGATYELKNACANIKNQDDVTNLLKLGQIVSDELWSNTAHAHWAGVRATTPDYLPLVGPIADAKKFLQIFASLASNSKRWIAQAGSYYPGLYACAGFGSRGLTTIPLSAEWLASLINQEISVIPRELQHALSPARFLRKNIIRGNVKID